MFLYVGVMIFLGWFFIYIIMGVIGAGAMTSDFTPPDYITEEECKHQNKIGKYLEFNDIPMDQSFTNVYISALKILINHRRYDLYKDARPRWFPDDLDEYQARLNGKIK